MRMMETLFDFDKPHFAAWVRIYDMDVRRWFPDGGYREPLYYAALCGFYNLVEHLIKKYPGHVNALGGNTTIRWSQHYTKDISRSQISYFSTARTLTDEERHGRTPLHQAVDMVQRDVFRRGAVSARTWRGCKCQQSGPPDTTTPGGNLGE
jgi:hypothetical protein